MQRNFSHTFCRHFGVPPERFEEEVLQRTLYWHARWVYTLGSGDFELDRDFIFSVGQLTRRRSFSGEVHAFQRDPRNRTFWRQTGRLRVSVDRLRMLFYVVWSDAA